MTALSYLWAFVLLLSILVFVHALGHFVVARACGLRVPSFDRLGPRSSSAATAGVAPRARYVIAWFPLGAS